MSEKLRSRDRKAFEALVDEHQNMVYTVCLRVAKDADLAADLAQEVFMKVYRALPSFRGESELSTWIYRIAYNTAVSEIAKARYRYEVIGTEIQEESAASESDSAPAGEGGAAVFAAPTQLDELERQDRMELVERLIELLNPDQRMVVTLYYQAERSYREIARIMDVPIGTVKTLLFRAKERMRRLIVDVGEGVDL